jgi:hypothetical protein
MVMAVGASARAHWIPASGTSDLPDSSGDLPADQLLGASKARYQTQSRQRPLHRSMAAIPTTTSCYQERIATLQERLKLLLATSEASAGCPDDLELLEQEIQPVYAAIWAMYAEVEDDEG